MGVDRVKAVFRFLKNAGITIACFKVRAELGRFGQGGNDPVEFPLGNGNVVLRATAVRDFGTTGAFVVKGTDLFEVNTRKLIFRHFKRLPIVDNRH